MDFVRFVARKEIYIFAEARATEHKRIADERAKRGTGGKTITINASELVTKIVPLLLMPVVAENIWAEEWKNYKRFSGVPRYYQRIPTKRKMRPYSGRNSSDFVSTPT